MAAAMSLVTMLAAAIPVSPVVPAIASVLVFFLPRAGWALAATAGAVALAVNGQLGSAMFIVLPAIVAAFAAMVPLPRVFDGALAGAGAFAWVVAMQAMSGTSLALSLPEDLADPEGFGVAAAAKDGQPGPSGGSCGRRSGAHTEVLKVGSTELCRPDFPAHLHPSLVSQGMVLNRSALALLPWTMRRAGLPQE